MQLIHLSRLMIIGAVALLFASCSKTNMQGKLIPKEASIVIQIDGKSLADKLPWDEIKQNALFMEMNSDSTLPPTLKNLMNNPDNAGIDSKADLLFFVIKDSIGGYIGFEGKVKDEKTFKIFNQQMTENGADSEKDGVQFISKSPICVGWTKEKFVYVFDAPQITQMDDLSRRMMRDSINISRTSNRDIGAACKAIFALKESNSLAKDEKFTGLMKETGDVHFWMNGEELSKGGSSSAALAMVNLEKFYKGNITTATMNFDKGKMLMNAKTYASEEMLKLFKKYSGGKLNEDMIKRMPGKDVVAIMALNFKPEAIRDIIKMTGLDGLINMGVQKLGFSMDDFIKANKGDILFGVSDLVLKTDTTTYNFKDQAPNVAVAQKPSFNFIFAASIGDKESFNKIVTAGKNLGSGQFNDSSKAPFAYNQNGTYFVLGNDQQKVNQYLAATNTSFDFINKISGEPFGGYVNIQTLLRSFGNMATQDSSAKIAYDASLQMWDNIVWKGGNYSEGGIEQTVEINLVDKNTNSLKQLNAYTAKFSELYKEQRRKQKEQNMAFQDMTDSVAIPSTNSN
ncbi:MAG: DUF4836 family protein [Ferruginibacter sp.]|nr:DUF4836 family protein [Ferruginibacter sp.]